MKKSRLNRSTRNPRIAASRQSGRKLNRNDYQTLEPRQLLATDFGINTTASTFQTTSNLTNPNMVGDIGTTHVIESIGDRIAIFDRFSGARTTFKTHKQFFQDAGAIVNGDIVNSQIIFDRIANRFIVVGEGTGDGNFLYIAIANDANVSAGWKALKFVGDSVGVRHNGELSVGMDADALLITTRNTSTLPGFPLSNSVYTIPRVDLYLPNPTLTNMSRFENLSVADYGDFIRVASSFEASDGKATFISSRSNAQRVLRFDVFNPGAAGATITSAANVAEMIFNFNPLDPTLNTLAVNAVNARQVSDFDITIDVDSPVIKANAVDVGNSIWFTQTVTRSWNSGADLSTAVLWFEITKDASELHLSNEIIQAGYITAPLNFTGPGQNEPWQWDMWNGSIAVNEFGVVTLNYTMSSEEYELFPSAMSSTGVTVNGLTQYIPPFDAITSRKFRRNTQFDRMVIVQQGLSVYENNGFNPATWSYRSSTNYDPLDVNKFWTNVQWANTQDRWSTQVTELQPNELVVEVTADDLNNIIIVRRNAVNSDLLEIVMDGEVTDLLPYDVVGTVIINGYDGADRFILDYDFGNPVPVNGFDFRGMREADTVETNNPAGSDFVIDGFALGHYNEVTVFSQIENLEGGPGNDTFFFTDTIDPVFNVVVDAGFLEGSVSGKDGDDLFHFGGVIPPVVVSRQGIPRPQVGDSVFGGAGFNTLSFEAAMFDTFIQLTGSEPGQGYDGKTIGAFLDNPIGGDQESDRFTEISFIQGSLTHFDGVQQAAGYDAQAYVFVDDENSFYEAEGERLGFFQINAIGGSSFVDTFEAIRNTVAPLQLNGFGGDDIYHFSSDAPTNLGSTAPLQGLLFAQGGAGNNVMYVSNISGPANTNGLILNNRISGIGEIAYNAIGGTFALNVWLSQFDDHVDLHSFFQTNTLNLYMQDGNDSISIQDLSKAFINVYGQDGDDLYMIERVQGIDLRNLQLLDSIGSERDRVTLVGTILNETWDIDTSTFTDSNVFFEGIEEFGVEARGGNDIINVRSTDRPLFIDGEAGNDIINIGSNAPGAGGDLSGLLENVTVDGGSGRNQMNVTARDSIASKNATIFDDRITGLLPKTLFYQSTGGTFSLTSGLGGIFLTGSATAPDVFTIAGLVAGNTLRIDSLGGDDEFIVYSGAASNMALNGGDGNDIYRSTFRGNSNRLVQIQDSVGMNELFAYGTPGNDTMNLTGAIVSIGSEQVTLQGSFSSISASGVAGNDTLNLVNSLAPSVRMFGADGNDIINVTSSVGVTDLVMSGQAGNDQLNLTSSLNTTISSLFGGDGADLLFIGSGSLGNSTADGQEGADRVTVFTNTLSTTRQVTTRDTGSTGQDVLTVTGSMNNDEFQIQANRVSRLNQFINYTSAFERLTVNGSGGDDTLRFFGTTVGITRFNGGDGNDISNVFNTTGANQVTVDGGNGNDGFNVTNVAAGTRVTLIGGNDNDRFNLGSNQAADSGDFNRLKGFIGIDAGNGIDELYANDRVSGDAYSYFMSFKAIRSIPGPAAVARTDFAGIFYDGSLESARLDGSELANFFSVIPSQNTKYYIDGNSPNSSVSNADTILLQTSPGDGHVLHIISFSQGTGYWDFTNGAEEVRFENIELRTTNSGPAFMVRPGGNGNNNNIAMSMAPNNGRNNGNSWGLAGFQNNNNHNGNGQNRFWDRNSNSAGENTVDSAFDGINEWMFDLV